MRPFLPTALALLIAAPALAETGVFVWNDPEAMAIRMITMDPKDLGTATRLFTLEELTAVSSTMTGISSDGTSVGLCRQERDDIEAPASLSGYDLKGRKVWSEGAKSYYAALEGVLPEGYRIGQMPDWFTFECADAGAADAAGLLAFDIRFSAGKPGADGFVKGDTTEAFLGRLYVSGKTGKVVKAALVELKGGVRSDLVLNRNPVAPIYRQPDGSTYQMGNDASFVLPKDGHGRVFYGDRPIRWKGKPVVDGFDFSWYFPQTD